jgi:hypothetical protein
MHLAMADRPGLRQKLNPRLFPVLAGPLAITALFLAMLRWTWLKWPDPIVDFGDQMCRGWQLAEGKVLYRDIIFPFGPFSEYVVAAWFKIVGVSLESMIRLNLAILSLIIVMEYKLLSAIAGRLAATVGGIVFVGVFAFGQYVGISNYNYICPYTAEATQGTAVSLAAISLVWSYGRKGKPLHLVGLGMCLGCLFLMKPEFFVAVLAGVSAGLAGILWTSGVKAQVWVQTGVVLATVAFVTVAIAWALLSVSLGPKAALSGVFQAWPLVVNTQFAGGLLYRRIFGIDDTARNINRIIIMLGCHAALLVPTVWLARRCKPGLRGLGIGLGIGVLSGFLLWKDVPQLRWLDMVRPFPLEVLAITAWAGWRVVRGRTGGDDPALLGTRLALSVFSLLLLARMLFHTVVYHYGFVLAMPAMLLVVSALMSWIPSWLDRNGGAGVLLRCVAAAVLVVFVVAHWRIESGYLTAKTYEVGSGPDRFWADRRGENINKTVAAVLALTPPGSRLFVVPEGAMVNYLARRDIPGLMNGFLPNGFTDENSVIRMLQRDPPAAIVMTGNSMDEFGVGPFGFGYGRELLAWINRSYVSAQTFGPSPLMPSQNGMSVLIPRDLQLSPDHR